MRSYAEVCKVMQSYAVVCGVMRKYAELCRGMQSYARKSQYIMQVVILMVESSSHDAIPVLSWLSLRRTCTIYVIRRP